jgi:hypothetical protein
MRSSTPVAALAVIIIMVWTALAIARPWSDSAAPSPTADLADEPAGPAPTSTENPYDPFHVCREVERAATPTEFAILHAETVAEATDVFVGRVVEITSMEDAGTPVGGTAQWGWMTYTVEVIQTLKGTAAGIVVVRQTELLAAECPSFIFFENRTLSVGQTAVFLVRHDPVRGWFSLDHGGASFASIDGDAEEATAVARVSDLLGTPAAGTATPAESPER